MKVLHVIENFNNQAIESWLFRVLRLARKTHSEVQWTFFCTVAKPSIVDEEVRELGAEVVHSQFSVASPIAFVSSLRKVMRQGAYDILHCHHDIMSALPLLASFGLPIQRRIVHVHNTSIGLPTPSRLKAAAVRGPFREICLRADRIVGVSEYALDAMLAGCRRRPGRDHVIHCGVETSRFVNDDAAAHELRCGFAFGADAKVLLFVGRMCAYKNPNFVVEVLSHLYQVDTRFAAVFAGSGPCEEEVRELARQKGLSARVRVLGWRDDVPKLMHACDLLIWPGSEQPKEGLGLGVVEAQAAGLPILMSRNVPEETIVVPELAKVLPLPEGPQVWATAVIRLLEDVRPSRQEALRRVASSTFSIARSSDSTIALYKGTYKVQ